MSSRRNIGHRAQRTGLWAESKRSNTAIYDPYSSEQDRVVFKKYLSELCEAPEKGELIIKSEKLRNGFIMPINMVDVRTTLEKVPKQFLENLEGVLLLGGSAKQLQAQKLYRFGTYWADVIFIHPFPADLTWCVWDYVPPPHVQKMYERAGATCTPHGKKWKIVFSKQALKTWYLRDVLVHELAHHVDTRNTRSKDREDFADWFVTEYGYKFIA